MPSRRKDQFPTLDIFLGESDIMTPDRYIRNIKPQKKDKARICRKRNLRRVNALPEKTLKKGETTTYCFKHGHRQSHEEINRLTKRFFYPEKIADRSRKLKKYWLELSRQNKALISPTALFNGWLMWVKSRRWWASGLSVPGGYRAKGGRGWRDLNGRRFNFIN